jgi:hypothetical protein
MAGSHSHTAIGEMGLKTGTCDPQRVMPNQSRLQRFCRSQQSYTGVLHSEQMHSISGAAKAKGCSRTICDAGLWSGLLPEW